MNKENSHPELVDNSAWPLCSWLVSKEHKAIFAPVAKNANTSLKRLFVRLSGHPKAGEILKDNIHIHLASNPTGLSLCDFTAREASDILADSGYFRYVVLRDPLIRAVSGYLDKFVRNPQQPETPGGPPIVTGDAIDRVYRQRSEVPNYDRSITFYEFVKYLANNNDEALDTHFKPQHCSLAGRDFDYIGTVEQIDVLAQKLAPVFGQTVDIGHHHKVPRRRLALGSGKNAYRLPGELRRNRKLPHARTLLDDTTELLLKQRFSQDRELWHAASLPGER